MHTLEQLLSGELKGTKTLKLSCQLTHFPDEIINLADSLEILDLSGNQLSELPKDFSKLNKLKIAFFQIIISQNFLRYWQNVQTLP